MLERMVGGLYGLVGRVETNGVPIRSPVSGAGGGDAQ